MALCLGASPALPAPYYNYAGAIHMHTTYSDGSGNFQDLATAAQAAGLAYILTSDHNTLQPLRDGHQRYWGPVLVLVGVEISTDAGHFLAMDLPASFEWGSRDPQQVIDRVNAAGGFGVLAHPVSERWPWTDWGVTGYAGMEIINLASLMDADLRAAAQIQLPVRTLSRLADLAQRYLRNPDQVMAEFTNNTVDEHRAQWDSLLDRGQQAVGIASVDAHARIPVPGRVFYVPTYQEAFESVHLRRHPQPAAGQRGAGRPGDPPCLPEWAAVSGLPRVTAAPGSGSPPRKEPGPRRWGSRSAWKSACAWWWTPRALAPADPAPAQRHGDSQRRGRAPRTPGHPPRVYRVEVYASEQTGRLPDIRRSLRLPRVEEVLRRAAASCGRGSSPTRSTCAARAKEHSRRGCFTRSPGPAPPSIGPGQTTRRSKLPGSAAAPSVEGAREGRASRWATFLALAGESSGGRSIGASGSRAVS